ncbi:DUF4956 domain-containing protein [Flavobacteriaceae bacterium]|jgi:cation transport ATPase|nr:DUF4956 domain-containing protein [Flavobacteriaceae bacterium]
MEIFGIPLFDDDFYKMLIKLIINVIFLTGIIRFIYYKYSKKKEYLFTFYLIGTVVFFLCFTLKKYELDLGMALGLFAIFGILRYRTTPIDVKEMTYLFVVIGISVMNALSNKKMSYVEILSANSIILLVVYFFERFYNQNMVLKKDIIYETIENIHPDNHHILKEDIQQRLGVQIVKLEIGDINFLRDTAEITVYYKN